MKIFKRTLLFLVLWFTLNGLHQNQCIVFQKNSEQNQSFWIYFTDKGNANFNPYTFFDPKAIERRLRHGQSLYDTLDFPVNATYLTEVGRNVDSISVVSRWLNAACVYAGSQQVATLEQLPFVQRIEPAAGKLLATRHIAGKTSKAHKKDQQRELVQRHTSHFEGKYFSDHGIDGHGVRIAIFDAGFPGVDVHEAFKHIIDNKRIIAVWDFFSKSTNIFRKNEHGTMVLSLIGGKIDNTPMGMAPGAEYLLARTETWGEPFVEEKHWLAAAEWADQLGADIISSSLGYSFHRYFPEQMNGETSLVAFAAAMAVRKGILVVNAAGNDGNKASWKIISTPADVAVVLAVGALDFPSMLGAGYSSRGPTADGRIKPDLSALGSVYVATAKGYSHSSGTSFACPLVSGFAACVMQLHPEWTNTELFQALLKSASLYPYFDFSHGYGTPRASYFFSDPAAEVQPTFDFVTEKNLIKIAIRFSDADVMESIIGKPYLYYHIRNAYGNVEQYQIVRVNKKVVLTLDKAKFTTGQQLYVHLAGYTNSLTL